jgi:hypothetical protein
MILSDKQLGVMCDIHDFGFDYYTFNKQSVIMAKKYKQGLVLASICPKGSVNKSTLDFFIRHTLTLDEVEKVSIVCSNYWATLPARQLLTKPLKTNYFNEQD